METPNESSTLSDLLGIEEEELDYGSDTESKSIIPMYYRPRKTPNPFPERGAVNALTALHMTPGVGSAFITKSLDEEQEQVLRESITDLISWRQLKVKMTMRSLHSVRRNVFDRLWTNLWHRGSLPRQPLHMKRSKRAGYYAKDTWCHML